MPRQERIPSHDWPDYRALPHPRKARRRRDGHRYQAEDTRPRRKLALKFLFATRSKPRNCLNLRAWPTLKYF